MDIVFSEGEMNMNWANVMKMIRNDTEEFINNGGWEFL